MTAQAAQATEEAQAEVAEAFKENIYRRGRKCFLCCLIFKTGKIC